MCLKKYIIYCFLLILIGTACNKPDIRLNNPNDLLRPAADFVRNNYAYSLFSAGIEYAGLSEELNGNGPFTLFAPDDKAFNQQGVFSKDDFNKMTKDSVRQMILNHVYEGEIYIEDIPINTVNNPVKNLNGKSGFLARFEILYHTIPRAYINGIMLDENNRRDIKIKNGILHGIDKLLRFENGTITEYLEKQGKYKLLISGLKKFGYWDMLSSDRGYTVMAPVDSLFEMKGITAEIIAGLDTSNYGKRLFGAYIFPAKFFISDLLFYKFNYHVSKNGGGIPMGIYVPVINDEEFNNGMSFSNSDTMGLIVNQPYPKYLWEMKHGVRYDLYFPPVTSDLFTRNGMVHDINDVLLLPEDARK